jgi:hypothetical protein
MNDKDQSVLSGNTINIGGDNGDHEPESTISFSRRIIAVHHQHKKCCGKKCGGVEEGINNREAPDNVEAMQNKGLHNTKYRAEQKQHTKNAQGGVCFSTFQISVSEADLGKAEVFGLQYQ